MIEATLEEREGKAPVLVISQNGQVKFRHVLDTNFKIEPVLMQVRRLDKATPLSQQEIQTIFLKIGDIKGE